MQLFSLFTPSHVPLSYQYKCFMFALNVTVPLSAIWMFFVPQVALQQQSEEAECGLQPIAEAAGKGGAPSAGGFRRAAQPTAGAALQPVPQI